MLLPLKSGIYKRRLLDCLLERGTYGRERMRPIPLPLRKREKGQLQVKISLLCRYIGVLIGKIRGHRMLVPFAPYIPDRDPSIYRH